MILSDTDIIEMIDNGEIEVTDLDLFTVQPASVDLHLSTSFRRFNQHEPVDPKRDEGKFTELINCDGAFMMNPGEFVLASCTERIRLSKAVAGRIEGKSSLGRLGLLVHTTAGFFDPGFQGYPTLELINVRNVPFLLYPGMKIAQMSFFMTRSPSTVPYGTGTSKYQNQGPDPAASKYFLNFT